MREDSSSIWQAFKTDTDSYLEKLDVPIKAIFLTAKRNVYKAGTSTTFPINALQLYHHPNLPCLPSPLQPTKTSTATFRNERLPVLLTLLKTLRLRETVLRYNITKCVETFQSQLQTSQTDAFSSIRTSIFGQLVDPIYRLANREHGESIPMP